MSIFEQVESVKNMLISVATGGPKDNNTEYSVLRRNLLNVTGVSEKMPSFVRTCRTLQEFWSMIQPKFSTYAERRQFIREGFDPVLSFLEQGAQQPADTEISEILAKFDSEHVEAVWRKALDRRSSDPDGAITAARTLLETVCKHILDSRSVAYGDSPDIPKLVNLVATQLKIAPSQQTEDIFKRITGGCSSVVEGLGALRNKLGDSHGKGKGAITVDSRHAQLAVNLAGALAVYLVECWEAAK